MNLRPGSLPRLLVCHSRRPGFSDVWPTIGLRTTASLKWSITAAIANAPPSRSYRLNSVISCLLHGSDTRFRRFPGSVPTGVIGGSFHRWEDITRCPLLHRTAPARIPPRRLAHLLAGHSQRGRERRGQARKPLGSPRCPRRGSTTPAQALQPPATSGSS